MDVVITYVDITPSWKENYYNFVTKDIEEERFRSYGVLDLQIKLIRKYMSWVGNIFVVISDEDQIPEKFDKSLCTFVFHKDIIPSKYLPCFNSCTIEMFLYRIKNLSEEFIYFNDDIFVIDYLAPSAFFINHKPCLSPSICDIKEDEGTYVKNLVNSTREIAKYTKKENKFKDTYIKYNHICRPLIKSRCESIFNHLVIPILNSLTRTRHSKNFNTTLFHNYDYMTKNYVERSVKYSYIDLVDLKSSINKINDKEQPIICINDNGAYIDFDEFKTELHKVLEANLEGKKYVIKKEEKKEIVFDNTPLKVALCAIAKNENLYIREWVEWYKNIGISKIFLYDNNELDGERFEDVIDDYIKIGFVEIINVRGIEKGCFYDSEGINLQPKCYIDCYENKLDNYTWVCFFDVDEFLSFKKEFNLFSFLNQEMFNNTDTILISWEHYDDNNLYDYDKRSVVKRFTHKSKLGFHGVKSIVRIGKEIEDKKLENLIHCFKLKGSRIKFSNGINVQLINPHNFYKLPNNLHDKCNVVLNHYKTKTISEYLYRHLGRHWGTGKKYTDTPKNIENCYKDFFLYNDKTPIKEEFIKNFEKNDKIISYYKKINSLNLKDFINKYDNYISTLKLSYDLSSKKYNKEKGIITLTSWKNRIDYVYITLCNLLDMCPGFHIVLVLSEEEFPYKEDELPYTLRVLLSNKLIEVLWTPNNYKTCKKLIFTIEKYANKRVPIITADDDCLYITNYAQELYDRYKRYNNYTIRYNMYNIKESWQYSQGPCTLYNPIIFKYFLTNKHKFLDPLMLYKDDQVITNICKENKIKITYLYRGHIFPFVFINEKSATNNNRKNIDFINCYV